MKQLLLSCLLCLLAVSICQARSASTYAPALAIDSDSDVTSLQAFACDTTQVKPQEKKKSLITRFLDYFNDANKKNDKRFDFSIIGGPHYATDTKLGLGLVAAGIYRSDPADSLLLPSNVSLFGDVSTVGFYLLGVRGTHIFPHDRYRAVYTLYFYSFPCKF